MDPLSRALLVDQLVELDIAVADGFADLDDRPESWAGEVCSEPLTVTAGVTSPDQPVEIWRSIPARDNDRVVAKQGPHVLKSFCQVMKVGQMPDTR